jgi:hypothetical protein
MKISRYLVEHDDLVAFEDLNIKGMVTYFRLSPTLNLALTWNGK